MIREHRVSAYERWDTLAWRYYGDATAYERIMRANPDVPRDLLLPEGVMLQVPVDEVQATTTVRNAEVPAWLKR